MPEPKHFYISKNFPNLRIKVFGRVLCVLSFFSTLLLSLINHWFEGKRGRSKRRIKGLLNYVKSYYPPLGLGDPVPDSLTNGMKRGIEDLKDDGYYYGALVLLFGIPV